MEIWWRQVEFVEFVKFVELIKARKSEQAVGLALFKKLEVVAPTKRQSSHIVTNDKHRYFIVCWENNRTP
jgi:hypothetical protein